MNTKLFARNAAYFVVFLPAACLIALELTLQLASVLTRHTAHVSTDLRWHGNALRVAAVGDSNTYGLYLKPEESYPKQLESIWNTHHPDQTMEVINLGYPGANSSRIIRNLPNIIDTLHPDLVLVMIGTNDFWTLPIANAENSLNASEKNPLNWIKIWSKTYRLYCLLTRPSFEQNELHVITTSDPAQAQSAQGKAATIDYKNLHLDFSMQLRGQNDQFNADKNLLENLTKLMTFSRNYRQRILFVTYPANKGYYKQANKLIREAINNNQYSDFIDVANRFSSLQPKKGQGNEYFFVDLHATATGNRQPASRR